MPLWISEADVAAMMDLSDAIDALEKGLNALRTEVATVPKQLDASLNELKADFSTAH